MERLRSPCAGPKKSRLPSSKAHKLKRPTTQRMEYFWPIWSHSTDRRERRLFALCGNGRLQSHEARIARQISGPIAKFARRQQHHRKGDTHPVLDRKTERRGAGAGNERRHLCSAGVCGQAQRRGKCRSDYVGSRHRQWPDMAVGADIKVADAIVSGVKADAFGRAILDQITVMFFAR